jgi:hypothetical protein
MLRLRENRKGVNVPRAVLPKSLTRNEGRRFPMLNGGLVMTYDEERIRSKPEYLPGLPDFL